MTEHSRDALGKFPESPKDADARHQSREELASHLGGAPDPATVLGKFPESELLDVEGRQFVIEGRCVALTPLQFSVMRYLHERKGKAVNRESLLQDVWGHKYDVGSNVVDVIVRCLRKKLGDRAKMIETVSGFGYRFRHQPRQPSIASGSNSNSHNFLIRSS